MKKNIHPKATNVNFTCSSCQSKFTVLSTLENSEVVVEICSQCHPFYLGKNTMGKVTGKAEKLLSKFEAGKKQIAEPAVKKEVTKAKPTRKKRQTLADLEIK
ncbi:large subunit ribosomal protein L31 [Mycoplasmoides fastidiosum]|uniref:50S ribosomal protein L31 n=1 Tax=Mycoplasmoides fastidiosum TaxID=92758 RepID=A0ABU0M035_9BACT|nr:50S ribosomal protein L31 [Mycoplasmoides fastidiosum]MDQ0514304.1 large subunit ribosomal protein L31 [Mycoplasmoides fastidiosum]UUD38092.1 50S ribosomal protein L31 [Mycoplasmoides fastidiosum]